MILLPSDCNKTYAVQVCRDLTPGIDDGRVASQLLHLADDHDVLADVRVDELAGDAGGGDRFHLEDFVDGGSEYRSKEAGFPEGLDWNSTTQVLILSWLD